MSAFLVPACESPSVTSVSRQMHFPRKINGFISMRGHRRDLAGSGASREVGPMRLGFISALAVAALAATAGCGGHPGPGPIDQVSPHGWTEAYEPLHQRVGGVLTDGAESITIHGHRAAVLDDVQLVGAHGLKLVGVKMMHPHQLMVGQILGFPPRWSTLSANDRKHVKIDALGPAVGQTIRPHAGTSYELYIGMRITRPVAYRRGVRIDYHIGDKHYSYFDPGSVWICSKPGPCHPSHGWVD